MHTCISWHGLKRSWRSYPRQVNAGNKNTPSMHHLRRWNVTTSVVGLRNGHIRKNLTSPKMVNPRHVGGEHRRTRRMLLLVGCLMSQQHASVSQGRICSDNFTCCHTEIEVADQTFYLTQSQYTDTGPTSPSADPITPGTWQGSHWSANFWVTGMTRPRKIPVQAGFELGIFRSRGRRLTGRPTRRSRRRNPRSGQTP